MTWLRFLDVVAILLALLPCLVSQAVHASTIYSDVVALQELNLRRWHATAELARAWSLHFGSHRKGDSCNHHTVAGLDSNNAGIIGSLQTIEGLVNLKFPVNIADKQFYRQIPRRLLQESLITAPLSKAPVSPGNATSTQGPSSSTRGQLVHDLVGAGAVALVVLFLIIMCCGYYYTKRKANAKRMLPIAEETPSDVLGGKSSSAIIPYAVLADATNHFDPANRIGREGRYGPVFVGELLDGTEVAIRRLSMNSRQSKREFVIGVRLIMDLQHRNVVRVIGCCYGGARLLVYECVKNGSLANLLWGKRKSLVWSERYDIVLGTAQGLAYLHEKGGAHCDIKAGNILLDTNLKPKIADCGLARLLHDYKSNVKPHEPSSMAYVAPEFDVHTQPTAKADVFSFGILALEIVSGRPSFNINLLGTDEENLPVLAWKLHQKRQVMDLVDCRIKDDYRQEQLRRIVEIALLCTQDAPAARPSMAHVISMMTREEPLPQVPSQPSSISFQNMSGTFTTGKRSRRWPFSASGSSKGKFSSGIFTYSTVIPR